LNAAKRLAARPGDQRRRAPDPVKKIAAGGQFGYYRRHREDIA